MAELQKTKLALSNLCGEKHRSAETFLFLATLLCTPQDFISRPNPASFGLGAREQFQQVAVGPVKIHAAPAFARI